MHPVEWKTTLLEINVLSTPDCSDSMSLRLWWDVDGESDGREQRREEVFTMLTLPSIGLMHIDTMEMPIFHGIIWGLFCHCLLTKQHRDDSLSRWFDWKLVECYLTEGWKNLVPQKAISCWRSIHDWIKSWWDLWYNTHFTSICKLEVAASKIWDMAHPNARGWYYLLSKLSIGILVLQVIVANISLLILSIRDWTHVWSVSSQVPWINLMLDYTEIGKAGRMRATHCS